MKMTPLVRRTKALVGCAAAAGLVFAAVPTSAALANLDAVRLPQQLSSPAVDKSRLDQSIAEAEALNPSAYTAASWAVLSTALAAARTVSASASASQIDVDAAWIPLRNAIASLVKVPPPALDTTQLRAQIAKAEALKAADYTQNTWTVLAGALHAARAILASPSADQGLVDKAANDLKQFIADLVKAPDRTAAEKALKDAAAYVEADYTADSWKVFKDARDAVAYYLGHPDSTQVQLDDAVKALAAAIQGLVLKNAPPEPPSSSVVRVKTAQVAVTLVVKKKMKLPGFGYTVEGKASKGTWKSANKKVATVSKTGVIKAKRVGKTKVTLTAANGKKATVIVRVVAKKPAKAVKPKIAVKGVSKSVKVGAVAYAKVTFKPKAAVGVKVGYKSSNSKVLSVDKAGRLLAKAKGKATLTVKVGKAKKRIKVTVG